MSPTTELELTMTTTPLASGVPLRSPDDQEILAATAAVEHGSLTAVVHLSGELCAYTVPRLRTLLDELLVLGTTSVVVDMAQLRFCTSHGINLLDEVQRQLAVAGGCLRIRGASGIVRKVLDIVDMAHEDPR